MDNTLQITYRPRADTTPERELGALATVYAYLLKSYDSKKANEPAPEPVGRDGTKNKEDDAADESIIRD